MGRHKTISDEDLLAAARQVFVARGYAASTREIAKVGRVSETVLYQRFKNKDALFYAAMIPRAPELEQVLGPEDPPRAARAYLRSAVDRMASFFAECLPLGVQVLMHPGFNAAALAEAQPAGAAEQLEKELARRLRRLQRRRLITNRIAVQAAARLLTSLAHDWALRNMLSPPDARRTRRQLRATVDVVWRSFAPSTPRSD